MQTIGTFGRKYTSVLTPQDMIYYRHPKAPGFLPFFVRAGWWLYHQVYWPQRMLLKGGDIITTVSHTSADDLKKARMTNKPIHVIYNAPQKFTKYPVKHEKTIKNIVYMGSFMPYKNAETLIRGMQWLPGRTLHLLSRISPERKTELQTLVPEGAQVVFHNGVSDDEYERLLADDAILATASLDEGYGIPVAEAMAMGVPVVVSDIPVFHEVGESGALYFDPVKPEEFAEKVCQLDNPKFRKQQIDHGLKHMKQFSWNASARALLKAIKDTL
jgi:glycosyltransferase involved in cell wall biosynthesis